MDKKTFKEQVNSKIIELNDKQFYLLEELLSFTLEENQKFNLTGIKDENEFRKLMLFDSLIPLKYVDFAGKNVLDLGSGAGFPGLPLAICSNGNYTLLDSTKKKVDHIVRFANEHKLDNVTGISARAEDFAIKNKEKYDVVISRAVASLNILLELSIPLLKVGGYMYALKGDRADEEILEAKNALKKLGAVIEETKVDYLDGENDKRVLLIIKKISKTNNKYPRSYSEIKSKPL